MQSCYETVLDELKIPEIMLRPIEFLLFKSFLGALAKKNKPILLWDYHPDVSSVLACS